MMIRMPSSVGVICALFTALVSSSSLRGSEFIPKPQTVPGPFVDLGYAKYQGSTDLTTNISSFLSIRYAAPPIGSLRFQAPRAPSKMEHLQMATSVPPQCYQADGGTSPTNPFVRHRSLSERQHSTNTSEDCLFLDVFVPDMGAAHRLPVLVYIHGGGYQSGNISFYPQTNLVTDSQNKAIAIFMQYRLGAFGFLAGPSVKSRGALNAGLLDQDFALQWVQQYISIFGGDASKVTIWGDSAGGGSVLQHVVAHGGRTDPPRFIAAMTSSAFMPPQYAADDIIPTLIYDQILEFTKCGNAIDAFACLVAVDSDTLNNANDVVAASAFYGTFIFVPVVDGTFIVERPTVTMDRKVVNGDVLLSVTNTLEGSIFTIPSEMNTTDFVRQMFPLLSANQINTAASYYTALNTTLPTAFNQSIAVLGESIFICPTYFLLEAFNGKSWKGEFAIPPGYHGQDALYYFPSANANCTPPFNNADFIKSFSQSFMNVVLFLDPNTKLDPTDSTPTWNRWSLGQTEMRFNKTSTDESDIQAVATDSGLLERCAFWHSVASTTGQ